MKKVSAGAQKLARGWFRRNGRAGKPICMWSDWDYDYVYGAVNGAFDYAHEVGKNRDGYYFHRLTLRLIRARFPGDERQREAA